jgi:hypothetical protein
VLSVTCPERGNTQLWCSRRVGPSRTPAMVEVQEDHEHRDVTDSCCALQGRVLRAHEEALVWHYHEALTSRLPSDVAATYPLELALERLELALLDLVRWMAGWGYWGNSDWAIEKARVTLKQIRKEG